MKSAAQLLATIQDNTDYTFPRQELTYLIDHPAESIPALLNLLTDVIENFDNYYDNNAFIGQLYAFYLLAQFREVRAYPLIIQFFTQYGDRAEEMSGDFVTEDLDRVLASVFDGNLRPIQQLIESPHTNRWVRGAAINSLTVMAVQNIMPHEEVITYFRDLFTHKLVREYEEVWDSLVIEAVRVYPEVLETEIRQAFDDELVDEFMIQPAELDHALTTPPEKRLTRLAQDNRYTLVTDTIAEMEWWAAFKKPDPPRKVTGYSALPGAGRPPAPTPKIGRNDPCHCGSGKKYKKCCWPN